MQMPPINTTNTKKEKRQNFINEEILIENVNRNVYSDHKHFSREQVLDNVQLHVQTLTSHICKPGARTQFTVILNEDTLILFGGLNCERLQDVWVCNLKGKSIN